MLPLDIDPKLAWALRHRDRFPLDVNRASREELLRVPGFGAKAVDRIIATRRRHIDPRQPIWPGCISRGTRRCRSSFSPITGPRRICSTARGWRSGFGRKRRIGIWVLSDATPLSSSAGSSSRMTLCM